MGAGAAGPIWLRGSAQGCEQRALVKRGRRPFEQVSGEYRHSSARVKIAIRHYRKQGVAGCAAIRRALADQKLQRTVHGHLRAILRQRLKALPRQGHEFEELLRLRRC